jgi:hypothetical protein
LRELDLNPVKVLAPGKGAIVVDGRLRIGPAGQLDRPSPEGMEVRIPPPIGMKSK